VVRTVFLIFCALAMLFPLVGFLRGLWRPKPRGGSSSAGYDWSWWTGGDADPSGHGGHFGRDGH
jgi:hypothetical protein